MIFNKRPQQTHRLAEGGEVDRLKPLNFRFDGKTYQGFGGDTLASALLANGVRLVGRSFKYHRPRGIYSAGSEEPNALVELRTGGRLEPNTRATVVELFGGLEAQSQHRWPSLELDIMQVNGIIAPFIPAGFYYKTFMGMPGWMFYEKHIRKAAGLGRGTYEWDPDRYDKMNAHCHVLIVGGGPSGLAAALTAGRRGARVILLDENDDFGGRLRSDNETIDGAPAMQWVARTLAELADMPEVTLLRRTTGFGYYDSNVVAAVERVSDHLAEPGEHMVRQRLWTIRPQAVILAAGATERPIVFDGNDKPGVMLASAVRTYINRFAVRPGDAAAIFTNNDDGYHAAIDLHRAGALVHAIVDPRRNGQGPVREQAEALGIEVQAGAVIVRTHGFNALSGAESMEIDDAGNVVGSPRYIPCDLLAISGGWSPNVHLHSHAGGRLQYDPVIAAFVPGDSRQAEMPIGSASGVFGLGDVLRDGLDAGAEAAEICGFRSTDRKPTPTPEVETVPTGPIKPLWRVPFKPGRMFGKRFVDLQDDVTAEDIGLAHREGYISVEHLKRYTTLGMGTDQGRTSNLNGLAIMAEERGLTIPEVGTTTFRPPYTPVPMGVFVGREVGHHFSPTRRSAMHDWHAENGATFVEAGQWLRPQYYLQPGEADIRENFNRAITQEVHTARNKVGMVDVSTLGKIDIQGPDAAEFLNRVYINGWKALAVGRARYGLMLREDGMVFDDGTTSRLGENHYLMTTTTAQAVRIMSHLEEYLQIHWPEMDVKVVSVTEQWAAMALAGPKSRAVLEAAIDDLDVSNEALPFMGVRDCTINGIPTRLFRISFSGELAYEINVPADYGRDAWERLMEAGAEHGIAPYGTEAMGIMRIEKGHVAGPELDGRTTADDLGLGRMVSTKKEFIGRRMLDREGLVDEKRPKLVGLTPVDGTSRPLSGAILVADPNTPPPVPKLGHVTSSAYLSPTLGQPIVLGLLEGGMSREGETVWAVFPMKNQKAEMRVVNPIFHDPKGEKLHG